ncbi:hypothetical protein N9139_01160 [Akkermansiaceae bacterium]|nr:hypothetical protein [Akkermansiaceae bacterium]MDB4508111.1 hypothetical protein [Akkermansiaceae bacterium]
MKYINTYAAPYSVAEAPADIRTSFYQKTYVHLAGAIGAFILLEVLLFSIPGIDLKVMGLLSKNPFSWLMVLGVLWPPLGLLRNGQTRTPAEELNISGSAFMWSQRL